MSRAPLLAALAAVLAVAVGCTTSDTDTPDAVAPSPGATSATDTPEVAPVTTKATIRKVTGTLAPAARDTLRDKIATTVDGWFDAAYIGGDYPRTDFDDAFDVFTTGARERALADRKLMSNAAVGTTTDSVVATVRRVRIDVLAARGRAAAVTVRFRLAQTRTGDTGNEVHERIDGHLYLTYSPDGGWQVFGYDVDRGAI